MFKKSDKFHLECILHIFKLYPKWWLDFYCELKVAYKHWKTFFFKGNGFYSTQLVNWIEHREFEENDRSVCQN